MMPASLQLVMSYDILAHLGENNAWYYDLEYSKEQMAWRGGLK
jgi:hypothetical protein